MQKSWLSTNGKDTLVTARIKPHQNEDQFLLDNDILTIKIKAPPIKGKANKRLFQIFRKLFKTEIRLESGTSSSLKIFRLINVTPAEVQEIIQKQIINFPKSIKKMEKKESKGE